MLIKRDAEKALRFCLKTFPVVIVLGPRQSGKTTLVKNSLASWNFLDLERISDYNALSFDIESFLNANPCKLVIDEAQRLPELFPVLRVEADKNRKTGRFVLTGSASPGLARGISESLAGRIGVAELTPFGITELAQNKKNLSQRWFWGGYPPLYHLKTFKQKSEWLESYISTFVERDLSALKARIHPAKMRKFLQMLAHLHGGILNVSDLARSMEIHQHTAEDYLNLLEGAFIIRRLPPYFANIGKRLVKSPKIYLRDSGIFHHLSGLRSPNELDYFPKRGASWEGLMIEEISRLAALKYTRPGIYYWRTHGGAETDLIIETGIGKKIAIEIKLGKSVKIGELAGLKCCMSDLKIKKAFVIYGGQKEIALGNGIKIVPWLKFINF